MGDLGGDLVGYDLAGGVATITLNHPPLNALSHALRAGLLAALTRAEDDPAVGAIVIEAAGRSWPVGADIREFGHPPKAPGLPDLCARIEACPRPVIAVMHGTALGGGLELALATAYRVAQSALKVGLPEVTLGLLPGAGGTQRLPRLIGPEAALEMMLDGAQMGAEKALALGLIDLVVNENPGEAARRRAADHVSGKRPLATAAERTARGAMPAGRYLQAIEDARVEPRGAHEKAAPLIIDCVEAALLLPPAQGHARERAAFEDLMATAESRALRHAFLAERIAAKSFAAPANLPQIARVAIIGGGGIGASLAPMLLRKGMSVTIIETDATSLARSLTLIARAEEAAVALGDQTEAERESSWARLSGAHGAMNAAAAADLVIDATADDLARRAALLATLGGLLPHEAPILSVTRALDPVALAGATGDASLHASLYLREPVRRQTLLEVAAADEAGPAVMGAVAALARHLGWRVVRAGPIPGFIAPWLDSALADAADRCLGRGALPGEIDRACRQLGLVSGAYEAEDFYGPSHPLVLHRLRRAGVGEEPVAGDLRRWLVAEGRTGRRQGKGWHIYRADGSWQADPAIEAELSGERPRFRFLPEDLQRRLLAALANAGAWLLSEGRARRPAEVDAVAMAHGFPRWRGGPMRAADETGLLLLRDDLRRWADEAGDGFWTPAPIWDDLIREGRGFGDLDRD
ncbi:enoyl-CoA hydratase-related protein [Frigidibacter sp. SD6-1]|uniref:enoyl-CoA hydratase-related protein n=1 Tax=Frigidibacter sp. SD6-1 TaxID=3032581 RepID=UPI0024DF66F9|nr:enoyl-CoA hydratase-related protein [Frigidibacter sp. SD6-1]